MTDTCSARPIPTKIDFPLVKTELPRRVNDNNFKPEYYAGSKLTLYNKYLLIVSYTDAFYLEEAMFNFYYLCKSFRNLLIMNFKVIEQNGVKVPTIDISNNNITCSNYYFIKSYFDKKRYNICLDG